MECGGKRSATPLWLVWRASLAVAFNTIRRIRIGKFATPRRTHFSRLRQVRVPIEYKLTHSAAAKRGPNWRVSTGKKLSVPIFQFVRLTRYRQKDRLYSARSEPVISSFDFGILVTTEYQSVRRFRSVTHPFTILFGPRTYHPTCHWLAGLNHCSSTTSNVKFYFYLPPPCY
jgi:hypothetical protein